MSVRVAAALVILIVAGIAWAVAGAVRGDRLLVLTLLFAGVLSLATNWAAVRLVGAVVQRDREKIAHLKTENEAIRQTLAASLESLAYAAEARTNGSTGHPGRVQAYAEATARALKMDDGEQDGVRMAALLHDIGKMGVPDNILAKKDNLTSDENEKARAYPVLGARLLQQIPFPWSVAPIVRHHREHWNGSGYPDGLRRNEIPLGARIVAVADVFDTLASEPDTGNLEQAMERLQELAGEHLDPEVVAAFLQVAPRVNAQIARQEADDDRLTSTLTIARAQREVRSLYDLAFSVRSTLCLHDTLEILTRKIMEIVGCSTCAIFIAEDSGPELVARAARGANEDCFLGSRARRGERLTGRVVMRGEVATASYMEEDIHLGTPPGTAWTPLRSTLIAPLKGSNGILGTINLYDTRDKAFQADDVRVMTLVGDLVGQAIENALRFETACETAFTDSLTGLKNARYLQTYMEEEVHRSQRHGRCFAVLGLDLDRFKAVNDGFGHERGDEVLRDIARRLQTQVRQQDLVSRCGGDEFAVILPETNHTQAQVVASKIAEAVDRLADEMVAETPGFPRIGVSIGIAVYPEDGADIKTLLAAADWNMYADKRVRKAA